MERGTPTLLRIGAWRVDPVSGELSRDGETVRLEVRTLRLLVYLAEHAGDIVSIDDLLKHVWSDVIVTPASVYQAVASLRRVLGDDAKEPTYIATVPRLGYRTVATVGPWAAQTIDPATSKPSASEGSESTRPSGTAGIRSRRRFVWAIGALCAAASLGLWVSTTAARHSRSASAVGSAALQKSVAVLPFLDLTDKMSEEVFADGLTEELIDRLNRIPGLRVPPPTSSFFFKNKRRTVVEIAGALHVSYVLDGSTRRSGATLRVAVRLIRAADGAVVWSETYDRPWGEMLTVQDAIAVEIASALARAIDIAARG
jgi:transcriptional activator of cad operon